MPVITLTSDYGVTDHYLASVKGTLLGAGDSLKLVDISHSIEPGNFFETAFILRNSYRDFPDGTVHLIAFSELCESGKMLAAEMDSQFFLLADNGLLSMINPDIKINKVVEIDFRQEATLFPARDVLCRAAVHLAGGGSIDLLGRKARNVQEKMIARPRIVNEQSSIIGSIIYIDNFGNLVSNISRKTFKEVGRDRPFEILLPRGYRIKIISENYNASAGTMLALFNSQGLLEIAISDSRGKSISGANTLLGIEVQNNITITFS